MQHSCLPQDADQYLDMGRVGDTAKKKKKPKGGKKKVQDFFFINSFRLKASKQGSVHMEKIPLKNITQSVPPNNH